MLNLSGAGLNKSEAVVYQTLISKNEWKPADLAKSVGESRTNIYKILNKLIKYKLAIKVKDKKVFYYKAVNPTRLLDIAREKRRLQDKNEYELEHASQILLKNYITKHEQPGVMFYQGKSEISKIFIEASKAKTDVCFIHTDKGIDFYGFDVMHNLRNLAPKAGVRRRALTPDVKRGTKDYKLKDPMVLLERTWLNNNDYTAPVEWGVFDNKIYIISYGQEAIGLTIESNQIAVAFRQLFRIIEAKQRLQTNYDKLPIYASSIAKIDKDMSTI
ncbi:MAG: HTH-type transcriptional regulator, sugar sensing transcriptional regulator [Patescibacteria group bacterium]|nr:HTH-type transcriptional regulator, sugar sensing transcriptional regulator [Patescibacteria group bacterium]